MANDNEITVSPQASQGETVELGSNVELVSDGNGDLKVIASSAVDMNGNQINDSTGPVEMGSSIDANTNDVTNVGSLDTESVEIDGITDGATTKYESGTDTIAGFGESVQPTSQVSTSSKTVYKFGDVGQRDAALVLVAGYDTNLNTQTFADLVMAGKTNGVTVIASLTNGAVASRSYSVDSFTNLQLAMDSGTYNVGASGRQTVLFT